MIIQPFNGRRFKPSSFAGLTPDGTVGDGSWVYLIDQDVGHCEELCARFVSAGLHVHRFPSAEAFLDAFDESVPSCVVVDVYLPGMNGLDLLSRVGEANVPPAFIVTAGPATAPMAVRAFRQGATDFFEKPFDADNLIDCVRGCVGYASWAHTAYETYREIQRRVETLTPREREVMSHVVAGLPNKNIAVELGIHPKTVEVHRARVMRKMQAESLAGLVRFNERIAPTWDLRAALTQRWREKLDDRTRVSPVRCEPVERVSRPVTAPSTMSSDPPLARQASVL